MSYPVRATSCVGPMPCHNEDVFVGSEHEICTRKDAERIREHERLRRKVCVNVGYPEGARQNRMGVTGGEYEKRRV